MYSNKSKILILILLSFFLFACDKKVEEASLPTLVTNFGEMEDNYNLTKSRIGTFVTEFKSKNTEIAYQTEAYVTSDKKTSPLLELKANRNTLVKKGDVLAVLDMDVSEVDLNEKRLSYNRNMKDYLTSKEDKEAMISSMEDKLLQMEDGIDKDIYMLQLQKTKSQYEQYLLQTERNLANQQEAIADLEDKNTDNTIVAPFDGYITHVDRLSAGDNINQGDYICHIVSTENLLIGVKENGLLRYNMDVSVTTKRIDVKTELKGRVVGSKDVVPEEFWSDMTYIALEDPSKYQDFVNGTVTTDYIKVDNVLLVDKKAVTTADDKSYVSVYEDGQVSKRYVVIGKTGTDTVWILQGLTENLSVITKE